MAALERELSLDELDEWRAFFSLQSEAMKEAQQQAQREAKKKKR